MMNSAIALDLSRPRPEPRGVPECSWSYLDEENVSSIVLPKSVLISRVECKGHRGRLRQGVGRSSRRAIRQGLRGGRREQEEGEDRRGPQLDHQPRERPPQMPGEG